MRFFRFKYKKRTTFLLCVILPLLSYYLMELLTHNPLEIPIQFQIIGVIFSFFIATFFIQLTGNTMTGLLLGELFLAGLSFVNDFVLMSRRSPILPWDLASAGTALTVAKEYTFEVTPTVIVVGLLWVLLLLITIPARHKLEYSLGHRISTMFCVCLVTAAMMWGLQQEFVDEFLDVYEMPFTQDVTYEKNGFFVSFFVNMKYMNVDKPEGYSASAAEKLLSEQTPETGTPGKLPNIIVVMNESFADMRSLGDFETNEEYLEFWDSLIGAENTISGDLHVSVLGGNTANTEYEFLTGGSMAFLPTGSIPYQQYITDELPALPGLLKQYGYTTTALHPYNATGWKRNTIYPMFGFEDLYFNTRFQHKQRMRTYITDESAYKQIIDLYEKKKSDGPFFSFLVTMQNHGGYAKDWEGFTRSVQVQNTGIQSLKRINAYLTCIQESDRAFRDFVEYFEKVPEDTIILMFGDHQPNVETAFLEKLYGKSYSGLTDEEMAKRYVTPFLLWANYDIPEASGLSMSTNYLANLLLETAGIPKTSYMKYLDEVAETFPILTANYAYTADGSFYSEKEFKNLPKTQAKVLQNYNIVQYYDLFGKEKRDGSFFYK